VSGWQPCGSLKSSYAPYSEIVKTPKGYRKITLEYTGDVNEMNKINAEFPVRKESTGDNSQEIAIHTNVISLTSIKKLDDSLFEVPVGYSKVSHQEYYKLRMQAMDKAMQESLNPNARQ